ncbi:MAG: universal stress protein [Gemmatimonadaceae bacterium]
MPTETSTNTISGATIARPEGSQPTMAPTSRVVLVATDDTEASAPALRFARTLAERGAAVHALHVVDTRSAPMPPPLDLAIAFTDATFGDAFREQRENEVRETIAETIGAPIDWPARIALGVPPYVIVREARALHADLVVLGLRRHNAIERAVGDETTLHVMRAAPCPVVAVTTPLTAPLRRVLVAVDFSRASLEAARAADHLVGKEGTLVLAYVAPADLAIPDDGERVIHELGVDAAFAWFRGELGRAVDAPVEEVKLRRWTSARVAEVLLSYADGAKIDMLALGSVRHGRIERWILGSVTTDIARNGSRSMLVVPPDDRATA